MNQDLLLQRLLDYSIPDKQDATWVDLCDTLQVTYDYLPNPRVSLYQHRNMFRFNTDTVLLASFMRIHKRDRVLDIGTNNGVLMLAAASFTNQPVIGVELQADACTLARINIQHHHLEDQCEIVQGDVCDLTQDPFDVIISNPPYFALGKQSIAPSLKQQARHELTLTLPTLISQINRLLKDGGHCFIVHRSDRLAEIINLFHEVHMEVKQIQPVYDEQKEDARCVLIEAVKQAKPGCRLLPAINIKR